jgi:hypothetical protein
MAASDSIRRAIETDKPFSLALRDRQYLDQTLDQMGSEENLLALGLATISYEESISTDKAPTTFYLATDRGVHFAVARKAGFMKTIQTTHFVARSEVAHLDYVDWGITALRCYRSADLQQKKPKAFLYFSMQYAEYRDGPLAQLRELSRALGHDPVDVTVDVFPRARYDRS